MDFSQQREAAQAAFAAFLPPEEIMNTLHGPRGAIDTVKFRNGSRVSFRTCEQGREAFQGATLDWAWFDEEPLEPIWQETLARVGKTPLEVWVTLTPLRGYTWTHARLFRGQRRPDIAVIQASTSDNPHLPPSELRRLELEYAGPMARARLHGEYVDLIGLGVVPSELLMALRAVQAQPIRAERETGGLGELKVFEEPEEDAQYVVGADPALGDPAPNRDFQVVQVLRRSPFRQAAVWCGKVGADRFGLLAAELAARYHEAPLAIERNGLGLAALLAARDYPNLYSEERFGRVTPSEWSPAARIGWVTNSETRPLMQSGLLAALRDGLLVFDSTTIEELAALVMDHLGRFCARQGWHDDHAVALMLAVQMQFLVPAEPLRAKPPPPPPEHEAHALFIAQLQHDHIRRAARRAQRASRFLPVEEESAAVNRKTSE